MAGMITMPFKDIYEPPPVTVINTKALHKSLFKINNIHFLPWQQCFYSSFLIICCYITVKWISWTLLGYVSRRNLNSLLTRRYSTFGYQITIFHGFCIRAFAWINRVAQCHYISWYFHYLLHKNGLILCSTYTSRKLHYGSSVRYSPMVH